MKVTDYNPISKRRPKLLLIENSIHYTGAFKAALTIAGALQAFYDVEFVLPSHSTLIKDVEKKGLVCHQLPIVQIGRSPARLFRYIPYLLLNTFLLRRLMSVLKVEVLIVNDYYNLLGVMAKITGWKGMLITMVRLMPMNQQRFLNYIWTFLGIKFSNRLIAVSRAVYHQLPKNNKVEMIYNPIHCDEKYMEDWVEKASGSDGVVRCLYLANYIIGKGHDYALEAFSHAYAINPSLRLRFVGSVMGLEKNILLKQFLHKKAEDMGLSKVVIIDDASDDVEKDIKDSDIVLNFSESESFSRTCIEASAFGRAIIATDCGGPREIIDNGVSGLIVPVRDIQAMTEALLMLASNETLRRSMGKSGKNIVRERFSEQIFLRRFLSLSGLDLSGAI